MYIALHQLNINTPTLCIYAYIYFLLHVIIILILLCKIYLPPNPQLFDPVHA